MLIVNLSVNYRHDVAEIKIIRKTPHTKLPRHFWYSYSAKTDMGKRYSGKVLHNYDSGAITLTNKVTKAIVAQQKAERIK